MEMHWEKLKFGLTSFLSLTSAYFGLIEFGPLPFQVSQVLHIHVYHIPTYRKNQVTELDSLAQTYAESGLAKVKYALAKVLHVLSKSHQCILYIHYFLSNSL